MRRLAQALLAVAVFLLFVAEAQRSDAANDARQAQAGVTARAARADRILGVRRPHPVQLSYQAGQ